MISSWITGLLLVQVVHSYVLLTATVDDVHAIAKQILESPVADQLHHILRRASSIFNQQVRSNDIAGDRKRNFRTNPQDSESLQPVQSNQEGRRSITKSRNSHQARRRQTKEDRNNKQSQEYASSGNQKSQSEMQGSSVVINGHNDENRHNTEPSHDDRARQTEDTSVPQKNASNEHKKSSQIEGESVGVLHQDKSDKSSELDHEKASKKLSHTDEVVALGKNASLYLNSMKKIIENV